MKQIKTIFIALGLILMIAIVILSTDSIVNASPLLAPFGFTTTPNPDPTEVPPDPTEIPPDPTEVPPDPTEVPPEPTKRPPIKTEINPKPSKEPKPKATRTAVPTVSGSLLLTRTMVVPPNLTGSCEPKVTYMVKFVCGYQDSNFTVVEPGVKSANYATAINLHNYSDEWVCGLKRPSLDYTEFNQALPPVINLQGFEIAPFSVLEVDCNSIWASTDNPYGTFLKGMIEISLGQNLPAVAVYTAQITDQMEFTNTGAGISIDVEYLTPFVK